MSFINEILPVPIVNGYGSRIAANAFDAGLGFTVTLGLKVGWPASPGGGGQRKPAAACARMHLRTPFALRGPRPSPGPRPRTST